MSINAAAATTQAPEIGSEEWMAQKLSALGLQDDQSDEAGLDPAQGDEPEAADNAAGGNAPTEASTAPTWREAVIPENDDTVPQHFRGKRTADVWDSYRNLERQWNEDRARIRQLEAKVAAKETFKEILAEQQAAAAQPQSPTDPFRAAGLDLETDPVLHPTKFFPKQQELILTEVNRLVEQKLAEQAQIAQRQAEEQAKVQRVAAAIGSIEKARGLTEAQMRARIPSIMMTAGERLGPDGLADSNALLSIHDEIFGATQPVSIPASHTAPNPPGVKRPAAVEPKPQTVGPQLKSYERDILNGVSEQITESGIKLDPERLAARYLANLKRVRG